MSPVPAPDPRMVAAIERMLIELLRLHLGNTETYRVVKQMWEDLTGQEWRI
jgi:hypothetical protein